jgi:hypothetical protein
MAGARDLKSRGNFPVSVQVRSRLPSYVAVAVCIVDSRDQNDGNGSRWPHFLIAESEPVGE